MAFCKGLVAETGLDLALGIGFGPELGAAEILREHPFVVHGGMNGFGDEFNVLYMRAPLDLCVKSAEMAEDVQARHTFRTIAKQ